MTQIDEAVLPENQDLIAEPDAGYRWKHLIMAVLMIAGGLWFAYDGWVKWPEDNRRADQLQRDRDAAKDANDPAKTEELARQLGQISKHTELDIAIQKVLAFALPSVGLFWGIWTLRDTRGRLRLSNDTLEAPGHPPIQFSDIRRIDKRKWEKKGIAFINYEIGSPPKSGVVKLDDFAYERKPVDAMLERIEKGVLLSGDGAVASES